MDAEAAQEWAVRCRMPQPSSKSRQTVGASHALPLVEVPTAGPPATEGAAGRAAANLVCAYPVQSGHRGDRTTLPSESYINAQKTVTTGQPLGIYQGLSKNLRPSPNQRCEWSIKKKEIWTTCGQQSIPNISCGLFAISP